MAERLKRLGKGYKASLFWFFSKITQEEGMTPPEEYKQYLDMLGFDDFEEPYIITAGTRVYRFRSMDWSVPDIAFSWEGISAALESARILDAEATTKDIAAVRNVVEGLASVYGIYLDGFFPAKVWERIKFNEAMMAR